MLLLRSHLTALGWDLTGLHHHEGVHTHHLRIEARWELRCLLRLSFRILLRFGSFLLLFAAFMVVFFFLVLVSFLLVENLFSYLVSLNLDFTFIRFRRSRIFLIFRFLIKIFLNIFFL